jgi:hypothetical protein
MIRRLVWITGAVLLFTVATAITQIGGLLFLATLALAWILRRAGLGKPAAGLGSGVFFLAAVIIANLYVVPPLAALGGREPLPARRRRIVPMWLCLRFIAFWAATMCGAKQRPCWRQWRQASPGNILVS